MEGGSHDEGNPTFCIYSEHLCGFVFYVWATCDWINLQTKTSPCHGKPFPPAPNNYYFSRSKSPGLPYWDASLEELEFQRYSYADLLGSYFLAFCSTSPSFSWVSLNSRKHCCCSRKGLSALTSRNLVRNHAADVLWSLIRYEVNGMRLILVLWKVEVGLITEEENPSY